MTRRRFPGAIGRDGAPSAGDAVRAGVLAALLATGAGTHRVQAAPLVLDAVGLARGGQSALAGIDASPGSPRVAGWRFRVDAFEPFAGAGLVAAAVAAEGVGTHFGGGFGFATLWSPVAVVRECTVGLQLRRGQWLGGLGLQVRGYAFIGYATIWEPTPRVGIGWTGGERFAVATVVERGPGPVALPRLRAAFEAQLFSGLRFAAEIEREPGVDARTALGIATGESPLRLLAGFDIATQSCSFGFAWSGQGQAIAWGARTHPVLGWSHAWTYERGR